MKWTREINNYLCTLVQSLMKRYLIIIIILLASASLLAMHSSESVGLTPKKLETEQLPDLNIPRYGHCTFIVNGELTVIGGHTTGFVPTATAEYFSGGTWHTVQTVYAHDFGIVVPLKSGKVLACGGANEPLGIGQTYPAEWYDPATHTFEGFGCLDRRRVLANATQLADGCVIICGNHYANDAVGCYDGQPQVEHVKSLRQGRSNPYILPVAADDALILGANDIYDRRSDTVWVDRLKGDAFRVPLLEQWRLVYTDQPFTSTACAMADSLPGAYEDPVRPSRLQRFCRC